MKATGYGIAAAGFAIASALTNDRFDAWLMFTWAVLLAACLTLTKGGQANADQGKDPK